MNAGLSVMPKPFIDLRQLAGLAVRPGAPARDHRLRRAQQLRAAGVGAEFALAREPRDDDRRQDAEHDLRDDQVMK